MHALLPTNQNIFWISEIQFCESEMIYFGSRSSSNFLEFRIQIQIQKKVPDPTPIIWNMLENVKTMPFNQKEESNNCHHFKI